MSTARRSAPVLLAIIAVLVAVLAPAAGAAGTTAQPEPGPLSPAFVEALHDPLVTLGLGRVPSPVELHVSTAAESAAARMDEPSSYDLRDVGRVTPVKDQDPYSTCWAFANIGALESKLMPADPRARLQRGQPGRPQRLRVVPDRTVQLRRLRLHGDRLLRALGRPGRRDGRPVWHA